MKRGTNRVIRGGSWNNSANNCRVANRNNNNPDNANNNLGFRVCLHSSTLEAGEIRITATRGIDPVKVLPDNELRYWQKV